jgi:hypothetical protein
MIGTSNNSKRQTVLTAVCESSIPTRKRLVMDLSPRLGIPPAISGVNDRIGEVLIVLTAARENYGFCPFRLTAGNTSLEMPVNASRMKLRAILEKAAFRISRYVAENSLYHACLSSETIELRSSSGMVIR